MSLMADPMVALQELQLALDQGMSFDFPELRGDYKTWYIENPNGKKHVFAKIVGNEVQALAIFGLVDPIDGAECWAVGYAVSEKYRRRGLAIEAFNTGIQELKILLSRIMMKSFFVEAVIDAENIPSVKIAEKLFLCSGTKIVDGESERPALWFKREVVIS